LTGVVASQQLLIQRLEKTVLKEEGLLEQRDAQLADESRRHLRLKGALRRRSDQAVAQALGWPHGGKKKQRAASVPPGLCSDGDGAGSGKGDAEVGSGKGDTEAGKGGSRSTSQLPQIAPAAPRGDDGAGVSANS